MPDALERMRDSEPGDSMSGYKVTVTRTLHLLGRHRSRESAEEFARGLVDSGQLAPSDWETVVTVEPLNTPSPDPAADRVRRSESDTELERTVNDALRALDPSPSTT